MRIQFVKMAFHYKVHINQLCPVCYFENKETIGKLKKKMLDVCLSQLNSFYNRYEVADLSRSVII